MSTCTYMLLCVATVCCLVNNGLRVPGIDPSSAVFGVVKRIRDNDIDAHSNQQVQLYSK